VARNTDKKPRFRSRLFSCSHSHLSFFFRCALGIKVRMERTCFGSHPEHSLWVNWKVHRAHRRERERSRLLGQRYPNDRFTSSLPLYGKTRSFPGLQPYKSSKHQDRGGFQGGMALKVSGPWDFWCSFSNLREHPTVPSVFMRLGSMSCDREGFVTCYLRDESHGFLMFSLGLFDFF
jgi:hypothetical protein